MHRAHGAVVALTHRHEHRERLGPTHFANDDAIRIHAQRHAREISQRYFSLTLDVGSAALQRVVVGVSFSKVFEAKFVGIFDGDDSLSGGHFVEQGPQ